MEIKSVLVVHTFGLGDWIMFSPCLKQLVEHNPEVDIQVLLGVPHQKKIIESYPKVRVRAVFEKKPISFLKAIAKTWSSSFDLLIFPGGFHSYHADLAAPLIRAKEKVCLKDKGHQPRFLTQSPNMDRSVHRVKNNVRLLNAVGLEVSNPQQFYPLSGDIPVARPKSLVIHSGSSQRLAFKRWPMARFIEVSKHLQKQGWSISWVFGPEDIELKKEFLQAKLEQQEVHQDLAPAEMAHTLARHEVCLTSDSGIGHIAAALGRRTVTIIGPANATYTKPWGARESTVQISERLPCQPCIEPGGLYGCEERPCLMKIEPQHVISEISRESIKGAAHDHQ